MLLYKPKYSCQVGKITSARTTLNLWEYPTSIKHKNSISEGEKARVRQRGRVALRERISGEKERFRENRGRDREWVCHITLLAYDTPISAQTSMNNAVTHALIIHQI
jgi:hypothetical protein